MKNKFTDSLRSCFAVLLAFALIISCMAPFEAIYADTDDAQGSGPAGEVTIESQTDEQTDEQVSDSLNDSGGQPADIDDKGSSQAEEAAEEREGAALTSEVSDADETIGADDNSVVLYDGVYEGAGEGRNGTITVRVTISGGVVSSVEEVSQNETLAYWTDASAMLEKYKGKTAADDVDTVSGATMSSEGIRGAVSDALSKASQHIGGSGTQREPYVIKNSAQLRLFADKVDEGDSAYTGAYVTLGSDIDLNGIAWDPIGEEGKASSNKNKIFAGNFDGRGHQIKGMQITGEYSSEANIGLFSTLAATAHISNLTVSSAVINAASPGDGTPVRAGLIAGDTQSTKNSRGAIIDGCSTDGNITIEANTSSAWGGGILGRSMRGTVIINCMSSAKISVSSVDSNNASYAGCIIGLSGADNVLANCGATGEVSASNKTSGKDSYAGGIAGMLSSKTYNVYSTADVVVNRRDDGSNYAGIIAGAAAGSSEGGLIYYAADAKININGEKQSSAAYGENLGSLTDDDFTGMTSFEMAADNFADVLNANMSTVSDALGEDALELREWKSEDGNVILTDTIWVPGEIDSSIFEKGTGTEDDPYIIGTAEQLKAFAGSLNSKIDYRDKYIRLDRDIDISGEDWAPIGGSFYRFDGDFDGNGKVIKGLAEGSSNDPAELSGSNAYIGLFGWINEHARIHDLTLDGLKIYTHSEGSAYVGGITGRMSGSDTEGDYHGAGINNCVVRGVISHTTDKGTSFIGGVAGHMFKGTVINSMTDVTVTGKELSGELAEVGGMVGLLNRGMVANSYAIGNITGSGYRDTQYDIEGMACVGNIAAVNGGYIVNCYAQGNVEALEYSIDTGIITGWVTGIAKVYDCWYNEDASMKIDGRKVDPVDPFGETVAGGVSDEWGFKFPGSLLENNNGYHPGEDAELVAAGLNSSFAKFPIDIEEIYGLGKDSLRKWIVKNGQAVLGDDRASVIYVQPDVEKNIGEEPDPVLLDGTWYGRSNDKNAVVSITVKDGVVTDTKAQIGENSGDAFNEAVARARFKARFGDYSDYEPADTSKFKGSGTKADPYKIETEDQLRYLASSINEDVDWKGKYFRQTKDISVSGEDWTPIGWGIFADADGDGFGQDVVALYPFRGIYDGGNHTIKGLKAGSTASPVSGSYMGLFGIVQGDYTGNIIPENGYRAELRNIRVENAQFYTENRWRSYIGGLVANAQGGFAIDNCSVTGKISSRSTEDFAFAGGLSGSLMYGSVTDCCTDVDSTSWSGKSYSYAAGMSAVTNRATIIDSYTLGDVHADADQTNRAEAGGFTGLDGGVCVNCYARGNVEIVSKYSMYIGGFVGMAASASEHRQCYYNTDADQKVAGKNVDEKRYAGKFVNESAEANAQAQSGDMMASEKFVQTLENNRKNLSKTLEQVKGALGCDKNGSSEYHSLYYNGDGSDLCKWTLNNGVVSFGDREVPAGGQKTSVQAATKVVRTVTVNAKTVDKKAINKAIKKAGGSSKYVTQIVLGKKVKKIKKGSFASFSQVKTITIKSKKLKKKTVKGSLKGSKVKTIKVKVGKKSVNKKYAKKYRKIFKKKNSGKKVSVKY